jgi:hypothetical protein
MPRAESARGVPDSTAPSAEAVELAYRPAGLIADYLRAGLGLALCAAPLLLPALPLAVRLGLLVPACLCLALLVQTWRRQRTKIWLSAEGVALVAGRRCWLPWRHLDRLRLRGFNFGRGTQGGWLELELRGRRQRLVVTSGLERFEAVLAAAVAAAGARGLALEPITLANLAALRRLRDPAGSWEPRA